MKHAQLDRLPLEGLLLRVSEPGGPSPETLDRFYRLVRIARGLCPPCADPARLVAPWLQAPLGALQLPRDVARLDAGNALDCMALLVLAAEARYKLARGEALSAPQLACLASLTPTHVRRLLGPVIPADKARAFLDRTGA